MMLTFTTSSLLAIDVTPFTWPAGVSNRGPYPTITATHTVVLTPNSNTPTENELASHRYHHQVRMVVTNNTIIMALTSAGWDEGGDGLQVHLFWSTNRGANWSAPVQALPSLSTFAHLTYSTNSLFPNPTCFGNVGGTNYLVTDITQNDTNAEWQARLLIAQAVFPNGTVGPAYRVSPNDWSNNVVAISNLPYNTTIAGPLLNEAKIYGQWGGSWGNSTTPMEWGSFFKTNSNSLIEPATVSADGSTNNLYRLCRVLGGYTGGFTNDQWIGQYWSTNGGAGWSLPYPTSIPNAPASAAMIRLSDGRFCMVGNPNNWPGDLSVRRDPLYLAITEPNSTLFTNVWAIRQYLTNYPTWSGGSKLGGADYPGIVQFGNYLYVGYSITKETVAFSRVLLPNLEDNNNDYVAGPSVSIATIGTLIKR